MLSIKYIRENLEKVRLSVLNKNTNVDLDEIISIDDQRRELARKNDEMKTQRNQATQQISQKKKRKENADIEIKEMRNLSQQIKEVDSKLRDVESLLRNKLLYVPNIIHESVPLGKDESANKLVKKWGDEKSFDFTPKDHLELNNALNLFDFSGASKMAGSGFTLYTGLGAKLERSLINFMLDFHIDNHGYTELLPPFLANHSATETTGQLPKFADDMYAIETDQLFCIPTAEVPVTNMHKDDSLLEKKLPIQYVASSACFRREAGSYGKDTRGLMRLHQFNKVEMVKFVKPSESYLELENLLSNAEAILQALGLSYKIVTLASGDLSFSATKCYDIEIWATGTQKYLEVSSCSNFESFQARRGNIRYRRESDNKLEFVHTLNGSGVATPRLMIALLETYQQADGSIIIPKPLQKYMGIDRIKSK